MPSWNNVARCMERATIFDGASPGKRTLRLGSKRRSGRRARTISRRRAVVFINACIEWAEAAYLEPDRTCSLADEYLEAVRNALAHHGGA